MGPTVEPGALTASVSATQKMGAGLTAGHYWSNRAPHVLAAPIFPERLQIQITIWGFTWMMIISRSHRQLGLSTIVEAKRMGGRRLDSSNQPGTKRRRLEQKHQGV